MRIVDDQGRELPWDGTTFGNLEVRGPWVVQRYLNADANACSPEGWFPTGDVATIDPHGVMEITDRTKDIVKSGGEWISSIQLENIAVAHPDVAEAAIVAARHPKWDERPLLLLTAKPGHTIDPAAVLATYAGPGRQMVDPGRGHRGGRAAAHRHRQAEQARPAATLPRLPTGLGRGVAHASPP